MRLRGPVLAALLLAALPLAACDQSPNTPAGSPSAGGGGASAAGRDACLSGSWKVDLQDLATQAAAKLPNGGGHGSSDGSITVTFGDTMAIVYGTNLTLVSDASNGLSIGVRNSYEGTATSNDYQAHDGHITGTMATNTVALKTAVIVGSQTQDASTGPLAGTLDLAQGVTSYTCGASTLTLDNDTVSWHLTKA
jgi:hypothetical protein